ncbi:hypothetical protein DFH09DRAFT_1071366 [Mycena vulgaris]|nr:hypothetical protein DFH09DRAFT_1071366 [Mycena vulgaris]
MIAARLVVVAVASSCACPIWQIPPSAGVDTSEFGGLDQRRLRVGLRTRAADPNLRRQDKTDKHRPAARPRVAGAYISHQTFMHSQVQCPDRLRRLDIVLGYIGDSEVSLVIGVDLITPWGKLQVEVPRLGAANGRCRVDSTPRCPAHPGRPLHPRRLTQTWIVIPSPGGGSASTWNDSKRMRNRQV